MILQVIAATILVVAVYLLTKSLLLPYLKFQRYLRNKGVRGNLYPIMDFLVVNRKDVIEKNDGFAAYKELARQDPDIKADVINLGGGAILLQLLGAEANKDFCQHPEYYQKMPISQAFNTLLSTGLSTADGELWKQHRRTISSAFHFGFIKEHVPMMVNTAREFLGKIEEKGQKDVVIMDEIQRITGEIVGRTFFGENLNDFNMDGKPLTLYLVGIMTEIFSVFGAPSVRFAQALGLNPSISPEFRKTIQKVTEFRNVLSKMVQDRKKSNVKTGDLLGLLLETQKNSNKEDIFSDDDIVNEYVTFFLAGMDTTGHLIAMAIFELSRNPEYYVKVKKEVDEIYSREDPVTPDLINEMQFTHAVLKETARVYPPSAGTIPRIALVDHTLDGIQVKKGALVKQSTMYVHFNPKHYKEPERFYPERWLDKSMTLDPFAFLAFSAGPRNCIGQHFAMLESKIILAEFIKKFNFELPKDYKLRMHLGSLHEPLDPIILKLASKSGKF